LNVKRDTEMAENAEADVASSTFFSFETRKFSSFRADATERETAERRDCVSFFRMLFSLFFGKTERNKNEPVFAGIRREVVVSPGGVTVCEQPPHAISVCK
jgi:hypothetical protein